MWTQSKQKVYLTYHVFSFVDAEGFALVHSQIKEFSQTTLAFMTGSLEADNL